MGNTLRLGRILGIELPLDYSWFIVFFLVGWSLASLHVRWAGMLTAIVFFASVVTHELAHCVVFQAFGPSVWPARAW